LRKWVHLDDVAVVSLGIVFDTFSVVLATVIGVNKRKRGPRTLVGAGDDAGYLGFVDTVLEGSQGIIAILELQEI